MDETIFQSRPIARRPYLLSCVRISLIKRWGWLLSAAVFGAVVGVLLGLHLLATVTLAAVSTLTVAAYIAFDSWQRHRSDL